MNLFPAMKMSILKEGLESGIKVRVIASTTPSVLRHRKFDKKELRERKILLYKKISLKVEKDIYGNKVAIISLKELMGVIIENQEIAETERLIFELAWRGAEKYKIEK